MDIIDAPLPVEKPSGAIVPQAQPVAALSGLDPVLDDNAVRQALLSAEANNQDPMTVTIGDMTQGQSSKPAEPTGNTTPQAPVAPTLEVPQKFLKPDGEVDVEKLQTSTKQLDEALKQKEAALQKTVEDYLKEYQDLENKFRNTPNPQKLAASLPSNPPPMSAPQPAVPPLNPSQMTDQQLEELINRDIQANPGKTIAQLIQLALDSRLQPFEQDKKLGNIRSNIAKIAERDPRVMRQDVFNAINGVLSREPELYNLRNPHEVAWLKVKEEMRLGELQQAQAQPSKAPSPVLGGGTPPSAPSVAVPQTPQNVIANLDKIDLRDRRQEALADEAIRAFLSRGR